MNTGVFQSWQSESFSRAHFILLGGPALSMGPPTHPMPPSAATLPALSIFTPLGFHKLLSIVITIGFIILDIQKCHSKSESSDKEPYLKTVL